MELNFNLFEGVMKKLPINYYLKSDRQINVSLSKDAPTSYYAPPEDRIVLSFPRMLDAMKRLKDTTFLEKLIRRTCYHEVSHIIWTPPELFGYDITYKDVINIFEDERIETIASEYKYPNGDMGYFLDVDFKWGVFAMNEFHGEPPVSAREYFFHICRFRVGEQKWLDRVNQIIDDYYFIDGTYEDCPELREEIIDFYIQVTKEWMEQHQKDDIDAVDPQYDSKNEEGKTETIKTMIEMGMDGGPGNTGEGYILIDWNGNPIGGECGETLGQGVQVVLDPNGNIDGIKIEPNTMTPEEIKKMEELCEEAKKEQAKVSKQAGTKRGKGLEPQKIINSLLNQFSDVNLTEQINQILSSFVKRYKNNGSAVNRYSGIMNPKEIGTRKDWKVWTYKCDNGNIKGYSKLHLNLFIDTSGSFSPNVKRVNTLLRSLKEMERRYNFFSYDVVGCEVGEHLFPKDARFIRAGGGTRMDNEVWDIFKKLQDLKSYNYNIILFDGEEGSKVNFGAFNSNKCSIISDSSNERSIKEYAPNAHSIIVHNCGHNENYAQLLTDNVIIALKRALA